MTAPTLRTFSGTLLLLGAGKMGGALLDGWLARGLSPKKIAVIEPQPPKSLKALTGRGLTLNPKSKIKTVLAIVIAVKPQSAPAALPALAAYAHKSTVAISIMAGRTSGFIE